MSIWRRFRRKGIGVVDKCATCQRKICKKRRKATQGARKSCPKYMAKARTTTKKK